MTTPYYSAEYRPTFDPDSPIGLRRRGQEPTGLPESDAWRDTGGVSMMSVADAITLRDSLTAATEAAAPKQEPMKAPRTCWTCKHYSQQVCTQPATDPSYQETERWYQSDNTDDNGEPTPSAAPCPGFTEPKP